ncbi:hypothetical protein HU200_067492 [Digitaria exilis]|uniref:GATA-type domain-containing protein n=1 Tax=Digitaria exilis TaxID=1010633 RepID=A0A835DSC3_9POAL|nr:hypothetical protein HU200_067492 [Digitaria exilis]
MRTESTSQPEEEETRTPKRQESTQQAQPRLGGGISGSIPSCSARLLRTPRLNQRQRRQQQQPALSCPKTLTPLALPARPPIHPSISHRPSCFFPSLPSPCVGRIISLEDRISERSIASIAPACLPAAFHSMGMEMEIEADPNTSLSPDDATASGESKACADCHTTKTPLWRGGPEGPKSLCNACGIRYRKRRRQALSLDAADPPKKKAADPQEEDQQQPKKKPAAASSSSASTKKEREKADKDKDRKKKDRQVTVELRVVGFGKEVMLKQRRQMRRNKCMSEEERAAVLLMALSSGVIYAS